MGNEENTHEDQKGLRGRLTTDRTFVLQFREPTDTASAWLDGRVEHIASGRALLFQGMDDLLAFLEDTLREKKR